MGIDWCHFFKVSTINPQPSFSIDLRLAPSLESLPTDINAEHHPLARLNLMRAADLELPSGPAVAEAMQLAPLTGLLGADVKSEALKEGPPLWYYVLAEAQTLHGGEHLGPVGGRIVGEVLVGLLQADANSYLRVKPSWLPNELLPGHTDFTMGDLVRFTDPPGPRPPGQLPRLTERPKS
jgi:hypothetical protein